MEKLKFEHLTGYLPYGLKVEYSGITNLKELSDWKKKEPKDFYTKKGAEYMDWANSKPNEIYGSRISEIKQIEVYKKYILISVGKKYGYYKKVGISQIKPILNPLSSLQDSDLMKKWSKEHSVELRYNKRLLLDVKTANCIDFIGYPLQFIADLYKEHYDIHNLIPLGLAIDIKTLESEVK